MSWRRTCIGELRAARFDLSPPTTASFAALSKRLAQDLTTNAEEIFNHCLASGLVICRNDRARAEDRRQRDHLGARSKAADRIARVCAICRRRPLDSLRDRGLRIARVR